MNAQYAQYLSRLIRGTRSRIIKHRQFTDAELAGIASPVLLMFGANEVCMDYRMVIARAKRLIKHLDVCIVPGAGHGLQGKKPEDVDSRIIDFLNMP